MLNHKLEFLILEQQRKQNMAKKNKKEWVNIVYSTNEDYNFANENDFEEETLAPNEQMLRVLIDKKQRKGKVATIIQGFVGTNDDLKELAKSLKSSCGVGGSAKDGEIIIQGEFRDKIMALLQDKGYKTKRVGG